MGRAPSVPSDARSGIGLLSQQPRPVDEWNSEEFESRTMKRLPLYRAPIAGLMSLTLATTALPLTAHADPSSHANNADAEDCHDDKDEPETVKRVSREDQ